MNSASSPALRKAERHSGWQEREALSRKRSTGLKPLWSYTLYPWQFTPTNPRGDVDWLQIFLGGAGTLHVTRHIQFIITADPVPEPSPDIAFPLSSWAMIQINFQLDRDNFWDLLNNHNEHLGWINCRDCSCQTSEATWECSVRNAGEEANGISSILWYICPLFQNSNTDTKLGWDFFWVRDEIYLAVADGSFIQFHSSSQLCCV